MKIKTENVQNGQMRNKATGEAVSSGFLPRPSISTMIKLPLRNPLVSNAFTLIELLVVITILGLLAALLLPALSRSRLKAQQTCCINNVRQLFLASANYLSDSGRFAPRIYPAFPGGTWMGTLNDYIPNPSLRVCVTAPLKTPVPKQGNLTGTADRAWVRWTFDNSKMFYGSYGYNGWLYSDMKFTDLTDGRQAMVFASEGSIESPSQTPVFFDENWVDAWPLETDPPAKNLYTGTEINNRRDLNMGRCTISRHGGSIPSRAIRNLHSGENMPGNVEIVMVDGHTRTVALEQLWTCCWHRGWQTPATRPYR